MTNTINTITQNGIKQNRKATIPLPQEIMSAAADGKGEQIHVTIVAIGWLANGKGEKIQGVDLITKGQLAVCKKKKKIKITEKYFSAPSSCLRRIKLNWSA